MYATYTPTSYGIKATSAVKKINILEISLIKIIPYILPNSNKE